MKKLRIVTNRPSAPLNLPSLSTTIRQQAEQGQKPQAFGAFLLVVGFVLLGFSYVIATTAYSQQTAQKAEAKGVNVVTYQALVDSGLETGGVTRQRVPQSALFLSGGACALGLAAMLFGRGLAGTVLLLASIPAIWLSLQQ